MTCFSRINYLQVAPLCGKMWCDYGLVAFASSMLRRRDSTETRARIQRFGLGATCSVRFQVPKASRARRWRRRGSGEWSRELGGYPLPSRLRGTGSIVSFPSGVRNAAPAEIEFCIGLIWMPKKHNGGTYLKICHGSATARWTFGEL